MLSEKTVIFLDEVFILLHLSIAIKFYAHSPLWHISIILTKILYV